MFDLPYPLYKAVHEIHWCRRLVDQRDLDGLFGSVQGEFRLVERGRTPFLRGVVGRGVPFLGHPDKVLVHLSVAVFVVKDRDGESTLRKILENYLGAHGLGIDPDTLLPNGFRRVIGKTLGVLKQSYSDLALGVSRAGDADRECSSVFCLCGERWEGCPHQERENSGRNLTDFG